MTAFALGCALIGAAYCVRPIRAVDLPHDARALTFVDRNGLALGTILGRDDRHTIAVPLAQVAPPFVAAIRALEDRRFAQHGASDPVATLRALAHAVLARRMPSGASTLSMQLAREIVPIARGPLGQLEETLLAVRLENGLSKRAILQAYVNRAPMGSNIYGVEAAARTYFGVPARDLDLAQSALLAGLPNDPVGLDPYRHPAAARHRMRFVLAAMRAAGAIDARTYADAASETIALQPRAAGVLAAAHALFFLAPRIAPDRTRVRTTIDRPLQTFVEAQLRDVLVQLAGRDVRDGAAIVIENRSGEVLAYVGSPDYFDDARGGRNDGLQALRQPGSTLKPFLYELALERRVVRPYTIVPDVPVTYALPGRRAYRPTDYAVHFAGPVRIRTALANSLNVPAVRVLSQTGVDSFLERLHALGFARLQRPAAYYGLGLTLGGGEVSLFELARAYAALARAGAPTQLRLTRDDDAPLAATQAIARDDPAWAFVTDVLADPIARSAAFGTDSILSLPFAAAVKTGTSSDFRDTWTAGFTREYTVAVWVGNFDGHPMRQISGVAGAAPLWNRIMLHLHERAEPRAFDPPRGYRHTEICATTGERVSAACPARVLEWLDATDRRAIAARAATVPANDRAYDAWVADQPMRRSLRTRILFPRDGDRFVAVPGARVRVVFAGPERVRLTFDGRTLARSGDAFVVPLVRGRHELVARSARGEDRSRFAVGDSPPHGPPRFSVVP